MKLSKVCAPLSALALCVSLNAEASVITFDGLAGSSGGLVHRFNSLSVDGYDFNIFPSEGVVAGEDFTLADSGQHAYNGTDMLVSGFGGGVLTITKDDVTDSLFSFEQFDAAEFFNNALETTFTISAVTGSGDLVSQSFQTDDIGNDGVGPIVELQTFNLSSDFSSVSSVRISVQEQVFMAFDNLHLSAPVVGVSAPSNLGMFGLGLLALGVARRKSR